LLYEDCGGCGIGGGPPRTASACAWERANETPGEVSPIVFAALAGPYAVGTARGSKELCVCCGAGQGAVMRRSLRLRMERWRMKKTKAPRTSMTQAMVMPTIAPVGRPCWLLTAATPFVLAAPSLALELAGLMAEATGAGALFGTGTEKGELGATGPLGATLGATGALGAGALGAEGTTGRFETVGWLFVSAPVPMGGRRGVLVVVVVVGAAVLVMGIIWVMVIGPASENCLAIGGSSGPAWTGRRFPCRARAAGRRLRFECIIVERTWRTAPGLIKAASRRVAEK
jgi:hypothetical protein